MSKKTSPATEPDDDDAVVDLKGSIADTTPLADSVVIISQVARLYLTPPLSIFGDSFLSIKEVSNQLIEIA